MSNLLRKPVIIESNEVLGSEGHDYVDSGVYNTDYKHDRKNEKIKMELKEYFAKYPTFKNSIFSNDHIQKMCKKVEEYTFNKGKFDKRKMVIELMELIVDKQLTFTEKGAVCNAVEFLHRSKLIDVSFAKKLFRFLTSIFR